MYYFFLDKLQLPVPPESLSMKINGGNKTVRLIDDSEINIIKNPGLTEVSFEFLVPQTSYPFSSGLGSSVTAISGSAAPVLSYLGKSNLAGGLGNTRDVFSYLEALKVSKQPFQFIVTRMRGKFNLLFRTNMRVTLEDYEIKESADYGFDQMVAVRLKQYRDYSTKTLETDANGNSTVKASRR